MNSKILLALVSVLALVACNSTPTPTANPTPQPLVLDSFAANPNPSPLNLGVQFSWSILGGNPSKTCKLDVNNDGTFEYTLTPCDSSSKQNHRYNAVGSYTAKLVVSDGSASQEKTASLTIVAENQKPRVLELTPQSTVNPLRVRWLFRVMDPEGDIVGCNLDFNSDGTPELELVPCSSNAAALTRNNSGGAIEFTYPAPGTFTATLEAFDAYGRSSTQTQVAVPFLQQPQVVQFGLQNPNAFVGTASRFFIELSSPNPSPLKCTLQTGDGRSYTFDPCSPNQIWFKEHRYASAGTYTATLTVQNALGSSVSRSIAVLVEGFVQVSGGVDFSCGLTLGGNAWCWGNGFYGVLGNSDLGQYNTPQAVQMPAGIRFSQISAGASHVCALESRGNAWCWGYEYFGALGNGNAGDPQGQANTPEPIIMPSGVRFSQISAGSNHSCALDNGGNAWCWGNGFYGQLGNNSNSDFSTPQAVSGSQTFSQISAGAYHTCALDPLGNAYCWGWNTADQLGTGNSMDANTPQAVSGGLTFSQISTGLFHTCALGLLGNAYCWGYNIAGQLGDGSFDDANSPQAVSGGLTFNQISAGTDYTCALDSTGAGWCWGDGFYGQLGNGNNTGANTPQAVSGGLTFSQIYGSGPGTGLHSCAVTPQGRAYCWGNGQFGQIGDGQPETNYLPPTPQAVVSP